MKLSGLAFVIGFALVGCAGGDGGGLHSSAQVEDRPLTSAVDTSAQNPSGTIAARIDEIAAKALAHGYPGLQVSVKWRGETVVSKGYGLADVENNVPVTPDSVFEVGSVTKQFTAAAILQLVDQGKLQLSDPLTKYLPDYTFRGFGDRITIRHMLSHTSGIPDYPMQDSPDLEETEANLLKTLEPIKDMPLDFWPGENWEYSNSNFFMLGLIVQKVTGEAYSQYLENHIFPAAGLKHTYYCDNAEIMNRRARGYDVNEKKHALENVTPFPMIEVYAAGAICSTADDLIAWQEALDSGRVISQEARAQMITAGALNDETPLTYGYALFLTDFGGHRRIGHGGDIPGYGTMLASYPDDNLEIAVIGNMATGAVDDVESDIARAILGLPAPVIQNLPVPDTEREFVVGTYYFLGGRDQHGNAFVIAPGPDNQSIAIQTAKGPYVVPYQGNHVFAVQTDPVQYLKFQGSGAHADMLVVSKEGFMGERLPRVNDGMPVAPPAPHSQSPQLGPIPPL